jgi:hypothetical protein
MVEHGCIALLRQDLRVPIDAATGETGGDWTEPVAEFTTTTGLDGCLWLQVAEMPDADTITGGTITMAASDVWGVRSFALKPLVT